MMGKTTEEKEDNGLVKRNNPEMDLWVKMNEFGHPELDIQVPHPEADHYLYLIFEGKT